MRILILGLLLPALVEGYMTCTVLSTQFREVENLGWYNGYWEVYIDELNTTDLIADPDASENIVFLNQTLLDQYDIGDSEWCIYHDGILKWTPYIRMIVTWGAYTLLSIFSGVVIAAVLVFGYRYWKRTETRFHVRASAPAYTPDTRPPAYAPL